MGASPRRIVASLLLAALVGSCAAPQRAETGDARSEAKATVSADRYGVLFEAARATLREMGFAIDRADHRFGRLTTHPEAVATAFEPWRDAAASARGLRSTLNRQRRRVRVLFERGEGETVRVSVEALLEQFERPGVHLTGSVVPGRMRAGVRALRPGLRRRGIRQAYWRPLGREPKLERRIRRRILARLDAHAPGAAGEEPPLGVLGGKGSE